MTRRKTEAQRVRDADEATALRDQRHFRVPYSVDGYNFDPGYEATLEEARQLRDLVIDRDEFIRDSRRPNRSSWIEHYTCSDGWQPLPNERRMRASSDED